MNKAALRKQVLRLVSSLSLSEKREQSEAIFKKLIKHPKYREAHKISIYLSTDNEVDTKPMLNHALEVDKKQCFIPLVRKTKIDYGDETRMIMVELNSMRDYEQLPVNHYGIKEPKKEHAGDLRRAIAAECDLDLIIVPGVAFDRNGNRLGHGKGYYDEFLSDWCTKAKARRPYTVGLAFREQLVDNPLAVENHDFKIDELMMADNLFDAEPKSS